MLQTRIDRLLASFALSISRTDRVGVKALNIKAPTKDYLAGTAVNNRNAHELAPRLSETFLRYIWVISYGRRRAYIGEQQEDERGMRKREKQEREGRKGGRASERERGEVYTVACAFVVLLDVAGNTYTATNGNNKRGSFVGDPCQVTMQEACA